ncbi:MAG: hypothetical protein KBD55_00445 [Candidatus Pacebacteria bacterium]|jgi:hypothetical protein|nr:hypothetical protein [Candidatus Paceibacterota bacterium]
MENNLPPHIDKIIGKNSSNEKIKREVEEYLNQRFQNSNEKFDGEIEKSEKDIILIDFAQKAANEILARFNRTKIIDIPLEHVHILKKGGVLEITKGMFIEGAHSTTQGDFIIDRNESSVDFTIIVFHELIHTKAFNAVQIIPVGNKNEIVEYRSGFSVTSRDGRVVFFDQINEAVVGYLTKIFYEEYVRKSELFKSEIKDIDDGKASVDTSRTAEVEAGLKYIYELYDKNKEKYSKEDIINIFIDAGVNGNLLQVGRLIEGTFGKGSFRQLGTKTGYKKRIF